MAQNAICILFHYEQVICMILHYSQTCLKWPLKKDKMKVLKTGGSLMQV